MARSLWAILGGRATKVDLSGLDVPVSVRREFDEIFFIKLGGIVVHNETTVYFEQPDQDEHSNQDASQNVQSNPALLCSIDALSNGLFGDTLAQHGLSIAVKDSIDGERPREETKSEMRD